MLWFISLLAFISLESFDCKNTADKGLNPEVICSQPKDKGNCRGNIKSWYFDHESGDCLQFIYGGCGGNDNNFRSKFACERVCNPPISVVARSWSQKKGLATPRPNNADTEGVKNFAIDIDAKPNEKPRKKFDPKAISRADFRTDAKFTVKPNKKYNPKIVSRALTFFASKKSLQNSTKPPENVEIVEDDPCQQPLDPGPCEGFKKAWYYDFDVGHCKPFNYGGCHGNDNNFPSKQLCQKECGERGNFRGGVVARMPIATPKETTASKKNALL